MTFCFWGDLVHLNCLKAVHPVVFVTIRIEINPVKHNNVFYYFQLYISARKVTIRLHIGIKLIKYKTLFTVYFHTVKHNIYCFTKSIICMYVYIHTYPHTYMPTYVYICTNVCNMCAYICMYIWTYVCTQAQIYVCVCVYIYVCYFLFFSLILDCVLAANVPYFVKYCRTEVPYRTTKTCNVKPEAAMKIL
jgi:hypothetical protein